MRGDTGEQLRELKKELFGDTTRAMSTPFLATAQRVTARATHRIGVEINDTDRHVYWIDGGTFGDLHCQGAAAIGDSLSDEHAQINGRMFHLDKLAAELRVKTTYNSGTSRWSSALTLLTRDGREVVIDASPSSAGERVETFIDSVLAALAVPNASQ